MKLPVPRFDVFTAVKIQAEFFWVVTLCSVAVDTDVSEDLAASISLKVDKGGLQSSLNCGVDMKCPAHSGS
jgi:hypothetical protein